MADQLTVKISADDSGLKSGVDNAKNSVKDASDQIRSDLKSMADSAKSAIGAFAGFSALKSLIDTAITFDSLRMSISAATGSAAKGAEAMEFIRITSERLGLSLEATAESYKTIAGASMGTSLEGKKARDVFLAVTEASAVMGLSADDTKGALLALGQMISKGTVSSEELKGQLGERIPGAFQIAAQAAGVTTAQLQKMLEQGQVISEDFLPKFAQALHDRFANDVPNAANSARASMERFKNSIVELKLALAESGILEFAEMVMRGWSYMASIISLTMKQLASNIVGAWADIAQNYNDVVVGGILRSTERLNSVLPKALSIDTSGMRKSFEEGNSFAKRMQVISDDLDKSAGKTAENLLKRLSGSGGMPKLEGTYEIGGLGGKASKGEQDKQARDAKRVQDEIQRINNQTVLLSIEGFDREEERARQAYDNQLETVGKTAAGRIAAENLLSAQLAEIQRKRDELAGSNLMAHAEKEKQIRINQIDSAKQIALIGVQADLDALSLKKQYSSMSKAEELEELRKLKEKEYQIELNSAMEKIALMKLGSVELAKANADIIAMQTKHGASVKRIDDEIALNSKKTWEGVSDNIQNTFGSAIGNLINFTATWKEAFLGVINSILRSFTQFVGKTVIAWAAGEDMKTTATIAGNVMRVASNAWASATSLATTIATAIKEIAVFAWKAAAAAYASVSAIPIIGPFIAPVVAAGTVIAVTSMVGNIASAEGGYDIPSGVNPMTQLHQNEMVLPAEHANTIRNMGNMSGGAMNVTVNAIDAKSVKQLFMDHGGALADALKNQHRNFKV